MLYINRGMAPLYSKLTVIMTVNDLCMEAPLGDEVAVTYYLFSSGIETGDSILTQLHR